VKKGGYTNKNNVSEEERGGKLGQGKLAHKDVGILGIG